MDLFMAIIDKYGLFSVLTCLLMILKITLIIINNFIKMYNNCYS